VFAGLLLGRYGALARTTQLGKRNLAAELLTPSIPSNLRLRVTREELLQAVASAYALGQGIYPDGLELAMRQVLEEQVERFLYLVRGSRQEHVVDVIQPKPMMSLRDVDVGVRFRPEEDTNWQELQWLNTQVS
jgi:hypothetical protein